MWIALVIEVRKLRRSLAPLLAVAAPSMIGLYVFFSTIRAEEARPWDALMSNSLAVWAFFMLPMSATALTALVAHMEHAPRAWDHLRALPRPRWHLYAAKSALVLFLLGVMSILTVGFTAGAGEAASAINKARTPVGNHALLDQLMLAGRIWAASVLLVAIQLWTALRFASFVPALSIGIGGTFFSVVATSAEEGIYFPWQMPVNMFASDPWRVETALALGGGGGLVALVLAIVHLSHRDVA